jgi:hypothetical protein
MLPYQEDQKRLEKLLEELFEGDEDVAVFRKPGLPRPMNDCCRYSYAST